MKLKLFVTSFIFLLILASCSNNLDVNGDMNLTSLEGIIAHKTDDGKQVLVIPNINESDIEGMDLNDLILLGEQNNGIYFSVSYEDYLNFDIGDKVSVSYDIDGDVSDSNPPIREAENISNLD